jgi:hypothetical protein
VLVAPFPVTSVDVLVSEIIIVVDAKTPRDLS